MVRLSVKSVRPGQARPVRIKYANGVAEFMWRAFKFTSSLRSVRARACAGRGEGGKVLCLGQSTAGQVSFVLN